MSHATRAASLDDLADGPVEVEITRPNGQVVKVPMQPLTEQEVFDLRLKVTRPTPPVATMTKTGPVYKFDDPAYLAAVRETDRKFTYMVLLASLKISIPGDTADEKVAALQARLGQAVYIQLLEASNKINSVGEQELAAVAQSFRAVGAAANGRHDTAEVDPAAVVVSE